MIDLTRKDVRLYRKQFTKETSSNLIKLLGDMVAAHTNIPLTLKLDNIRKTLVIESILRDR